MIHNSWWGTMMAVMAVLMAVLVGTLDGIHLADGRL
jgi:hypothetical protein